MASLGRRLSRASGCARGRTAEQGRWAVPPNRRSSQERLLGCFPSEVSPAHGVAPSAGVLQGPARGQAGAAERIGREAPSLSLWLVGPRGRLDGMGEGSQPLPLVSCPPSPWVPQAQFGDPHHLRPGCLTRGPLV